MIIVLWSLMDKIQVSELRLVLWDTKIKFVGTMFVSLSTKFLVMILRFQFLITLNGQGHCNTTCSVLLGLIRLCKWFKDLWYFATPENVSLVLKQKLVTWFQMQLQGLLSIVVIQITTHKRLETLAHSSIYKLMELHYLIAIPIIQTMTILSCTNAT